MNLDEIRSRINPQYADCIGTESYERKWLCDRIEELERQLAEIKQVIDLSNDMRLRLLNEALKNLIAKDAQIALLREALEDALYSGNPYSEKTKKALAATADLSGLVLCEGEPVGIIGSHGHPKHISYIPCITENKLYGPWKPIFRAREQK